MVMVSIIGGGVTGLNAAREFAIRGAKVRLFESSTSLGGLAGYIKIFDRNLDLGPHIFHTPDSDIRDYMLASFPGLLHERDHWAKNYKDGKYYDYPISREFIDTLPNNKRDAINQELKQRQKKAGFKESSYAEYMHYLAGPTLTELFFTVYPYKLWGVPTSELDANWAPKRIAIREKTEPFYSGQWAAVGVNGTSSIIDSLKLQCEQHGVEFHLNEPVISIESSRGLINKIITSNSEYICSEEDIVLNTASMTNAAKFLNVKCDVSYRGIILVYVHTCNTNPFPSGVDFVYFDSLEIIFNRVSDQNKFVRYPDKDSTVLCCEITYSKGDGLDSLSEDQISRLVIDGLIKVEILSASDVLGTHVIKLSEVYPMFKLGYREMKARMQASLEKYTNLFCLGSLAEFAYTDLQVLFAKSRDFANEMCSNTSETNNIGFGRLKVKGLSVIDFLGNKIGSGCPTFLIAEIGLNHNGDVSQAKRLIDVAKDSGFSAVKLQTYNAELRSAPDGITSRYVEKVLDIEETDYELFKKFSIGQQELEELIHYAKHKDIPIFSTPFDEQSVDVLTALGIQDFKVASSELTNLDLIRKLAINRARVIFSTGMASIGDIEESLKIFIKYGGKEFALLQCTSAYPASANSINLNAMQTMRMAFGCPVGYSDHLVDDAACIAAVALGASIIEKHVTLNRRSEGPDHSLSLDPIEQIAFVKRIRDVEAALGDGVKQPDLTERYSELRFRKTLHFSKAMMAGDLISRDDLILSAPGDGLLPKFREYVLGRRLKHEVKKMQPVKIEYLV